MRQVYRIGDVARRLHLSVEKVRDLEAEGALKAERSDGGHRYFRESTVAAYERKLEGEQRPGRTTRGSKPKPPRPQPRRRPPPPPPPPLDEDVDELDDLPPDEEDWVDEEEVPPPPARRVSALSALAALNAPRPAPAPDPAEARRQAEVEAKRLQDLKQHGVLQMPWVSDHGRARIIKDLEVFVTTDQVPTWLPLWEQQRLVRARVTDTAKAIQEEERAAAAKEAEHREAEQKRETSAALAKLGVLGLVMHGMRYFEEQTDDWDVFDQDDARPEVEKLLNAEVKADWSERNVEELVDEELAEWEVEE